jgi:hypothetical protein
MSILLLLVSREGWGSGHGGDTKKMIRWYQVPYGIMMYYRNDFTFQPLCMLNDVEDPLSNRTETVYIVLQNAFKSLDPELQKGWIVQN